MHLSLEKTAGEKDGSIVFLRAYFVVADGVVSGRKMTEIGELISSRYRNHF